MGDAAGVNPAGYALVGAPGRHPLRATSPADATEAEFPRPLTEADEQLGDPAYAELFPNGDAAT